MPQPGIAKRRILQVRRGRPRSRSDWIVVEEPLEIRVAGESLAVLMRTPGHDIELATGFALTEGIVRHPSEIGLIRQCRSGEVPDPNVVDIVLAPGAVFDHARLRRSLMTSAACGLCGKASIEALAVQASPVRSALRLRRSVLEALPKKLRAAQKSFGRTGALHASGLFDADGRLTVCREDVGRHNAVDKVVGRAIIDGAPLGEAILLVSGRTSFEILQKAAVAGIPVVCAISGPTTLAIDTARAFGITLVNFLRGHAMNIAARPERVLDGRPGPAAGRARRRRAAGRRGGDGPV
jgi:FdhD protein